MNRLITLVALGLIPTFGFCQGSQESLNKQPKVKPHVSSTPVTQAEAYEMFQKVEKAFRAVNEVTEKGPATKLTHANTPVTRDQTVIEMGRLFDLVRPKFTLKTTPVTFDPSVFTLHDKTAKIEANKLVGWGCIGRFAPMVAGEGSTMQVSPFGDAVGLFIARIAELTHVPSSRFSPYLKTFTLGPSDRLAP